MWPGREGMALRERILIESRTFRELLDALDALEGEDLPARLGLFEYLLMDWRWLREPKFRKRFPEYESSHWRLLRDSPEYAEAIGWRGPVPENDELSAFLESVRN